MPRRLLVLGLTGLLTLTMVTGSGPLIAGAQAPADSTPRATGSFTSGTHGTTWVPELRGKFSLFKPYGWGTLTRVKLAGVGDQWVHVSIPTTPFLNGYAVGLTEVNFCATSTNATQSKPIQVDLWNGSQRIYTGPVAWWADNAEHCWTVTISPAKWVVSVGVSVLLHFANSTDRITLGWATATFVY